MYAYVCLDSLRAQTDVLNLPKLQVHKYREAFDYSLAHIGVETDSLYHGTCSH